VKHVVDSKKVPKITQIIEMGIKTAEFKAGTNCSLSRLFDMEFETVKK